MTPRRVPLLHLGTHELEDRLAPAVVVSVREATGLTAADVTPARDTLRADLGGGVAAGPNGSFGGLRREINWDGVPDLKAAPNAFPADFFNTTSPRGAVFVTPGSGFQVSSSSSTPVPVRFGNLDKSYTNEFGVFSPQRLFAPVGSNVTEVRFFVPGTTTPAVVKGFGAVFTDVDLPGTAKIDYFDSRGRLLTTKVVPSTAGTGTFSFEGVTFDEAVVGKVRITAGTNALASGTLDNPLGGGADVVALDDFLYSEPVKLADRVVLAGSGPGAAPEVTILRSDGATARTDSAFPSGLTGGVRVAAGDVNGDGVFDEVVGTGPGSATLVRVLDGITGAEVRVVAPFEETFTGGVFVAAGDFNGDGMDEVVVTPDQGGGPRVRVFNGRDFLVLADFLGIQDPDFRGGARAAAADLSGDGTPDLLVAAGFGGGPRLAGFDGATLLNPLPAIVGAQPPKLFGDFFVFEQTLRNGVYVAGGDLDGDGYGDVIAGGGPGGGPRVFAVSGRDLTQAGGKQTQVANFFTNDDVANTGGVRVAARDLTGDGRADVLTGDGAGGAKVRVFDTATLAADGRPPLLFAVEAFAGANGVFVG